MRQALLTEAIHIRVQPCFAAAVHARAHREGVSVSELLRRAVQREIGGRP